MRKYFKHFRYIPLTTKLNSKAKCNTKKSCTYSRKNIENVGINPSKKYSSHHHDYASSKFFINSFGILMYLSPNPTTQSNPYHMLYNTSNYSPSLMHYFTKVQPNNMQTSEQLDKTLFNIVEYTHIS